MRGSGGRTSWHRLHLRFSRHNRRRVETREGQSLRFQFWRWWKWNSRSNRSSCCSLSSLSVLLSLRQLPLPSRSGDERRSSCEGIQISLRAFVLDAFSAMRLLCGHGALFDSLNSGQNGGYGFRGLSWGRSLDGGRCMSRQRRSCGRWRDSSNRVLRFP